MSAASSVDGTAEMSPRTKARFAGALYLLYIIAGVYAQAFIADRLFVSGDAAATAANILANQSLHTLGLTVYLLEMAGQVATVVLFYQLLKPVSRTGAMLAAAFELIGCGIKIFSRLFYFAPLLILGGSASYLGAFTREQLDSIALLLVRINNNGAAIALAWRYRNHRRTGLADISVAAAGNASVPVPGVVWDSRIAGDDRVVADRWRR